MVVLLNEPLSDDLTIGELAKYDSKAAVNDSFHFWWTVERLWWIENGTIRYDE